MLTKKLLLILVFLTLIPLVNANELCSTQPDDFIVSCTIPDRYFIQDFTCLNADCTAMLTKNNSFLELTLPYSDEKSVILRNTVQLRDVYRELEVLNTLCEEHFDTATIKYLDMKIKDQFSSTWLTFSGQKLVVKPLTESSRIQADNKIEASKHNLQRCYVTEFEEHNGWLIESKSKRPYCELIYNEEETCFQTKISEWKFFAFVLVNPNSDTFPYWLQLFLLVFIIGQGAVVGSILYHRKELKEFIMPTNRKIVINSILILPLIFIYGLFIRYIIGDTYGLVTSNSFEWLLLIIGILLVYYISCIIEYFRKK